MMQELTGITTHEYNQEEEREGGVDLLGNNVNEDVQNDVQNKNKECRVWVDGCFDMMHFGHANALRQARDVGDTLVVGIHSDVDISKHKGLPIMTMEERIDAVKGCRWADEIVPNSPYTTSIDVMKKYKCDFCVHGNDITTLFDGEDCYAAVKKAGLYREVKRTQGISTTEIVGRMLTLDRTHLQHLNSFGRPDSEEIVFLCSNIPHNSPLFSRILPKSQLKKFIPRSLPGKNDIVVYVPGSFDLFHHGHIEFLKRARSFGTYLVIGAYSDRVINKIKGANFPILNVAERVLGLLSCRYVDEVIVNAPVVVTNELLTKYININVVCCCTNDHNLDLKSQYPEDIYQIPRSLGILKEIDNKLYNSITSDIIINRVILNKKRYEERERRKLSMEKTRR